MDSGGDDALLLRVPGTNTPSRGRGRTGGVSPESPANQTPALNLPGETEDGILLERGTGVWFLLTSNGPMVILGKRNVCTEVGCRLSRMTVIAAVEAEGADMILPYPRVRVGGWANLESRPSSSPKKSVCHWLSVEPLSPISPRIHGAAFSHGRRLTRGQPTNCLMYQGASSSQHSCPT